MRHASRIAAGALIALALGPASHALAQAAPGPAVAAPSGATLGIPDLIARLSAEGYADVREVERKGDKLYKVTAWDARGRELELYVDARSAEVLATEED